MTCNDEYVYDYYSREDIQVTHLVDKGPSCGCVYLDFSKDFDTISHSTLLEKLAAHSLDSNYFKLQRNALVAVDGEVLGGECRDRDICHPPQSLTPVNMELSDSWTVKANIQAQD
ncbi:hypothetical protein HGM15179_011335 [Zosterops borbonicus]|uniref:Reverse transcriptase domain-containing protein n=1 Tax=Zosterops borbonicus TaxID=364589 RepID=A0A8K1LJC0_9PASS|nr:hypothetical protein HGM15179_011335 [Zosterops borbonicus]